MLEVAASLVGIFAVIVPATVVAIRWAVRRIEKGRDEALATYSARVAQEERLDRMDSTFKDLAAALKEHMDKETENLEDLRKVLNKTRGEIGKAWEMVQAQVQELADAQLHAALNVVKSIAQTDDLPTLLYRVVPESEAPAGHRPYEAIWVNRAWTDWTGLTLDETSAGGDLQVVHGEQRLVVGPSVQQSGQEKDIVDAEYTMIRPRTGTIVGDVWSHGYPMHSTSDEEWYYVARIQMLTPTDWWIEHFGHDKCPRASDG